MVRHKVERCLECGGEWLVLDPGTGDVVYATSDFGLAIDDAVSRYNDGVREELLRFA